MNPVRNFVPGTLFLGGVIISIKHYKIVRW